MPNRPDIKATIERLLAEWGSIANRHVCQATGRSRQAVHAHLREMVDAGQLVKIGDGRSVRYRRAQPRRQFIYALEDLDVEQVWHEAHGEVDELSTAPAAIEEIFHTALSELIENAVAHSDSDKLELTFQRTNGRLALEVIDHGIGIFDRIATTLGLEHNLAAMQELSKGQVTTLPDRRGDGLYRVSRMARYFEIDSGGLRFMIDNDLEDTAVASAASRTGTRVRFEAELYGELTVPEVLADAASIERSAARVLVKLFAIGVRFVSRDEAKRLLSGLEEFREIVLDFDRVEAVGQGFVEEVFLVWAPDHPGTRLRPINMAPTVRHTVEQALRASAASR